MANNDKVLTRLREPIFHPHQVVLTSEVEPLNRSQDQNEVLDDVAITEYEPERVLLNVKAHHTCNLILTDIWSSAWNTRVNWVTASIYREDYIYRNLSLKPCEHVISFEYHPALFNWGVAISAISIIFLDSVVILAYLRNWSFL